MSTIFLVPVPIASYNFVPFWELLKLLFTPSFAAQLIYCSVLVDILFVSECFFRQMQFSLTGHVCLQNKIEFNQNEMDMGKDKKPVHQLLKQNSSPVPVRGLFLSLCPTIYYALSPETHRAPNQSELTAQFSVSLEAKPQQSYQKQVPVRQS